MDAQDGAAVVTLHGEEINGGEAHGGETERDARLLVAGDYPAKGLTVTEADLDALVSHFSGPIPVKVEHVDSPLDPLGRVRRVWREGKALMGRLAFPAEVAALLARRGAAKLSVGLRKGPDWKLLEASLTLRPHVATATLLSQTTLSDGEAAELVQLRADRLDAEIVRWKAAGKIVPATESWARSLLGVPSVVTLSDGTPASDAFRRFLEAQPPVIRLGELARDGSGRTTFGGGASGAAGGDADEEGPAFSEDERELLRRLGVDPADVARTMRDPSGSPRLATSPSGRG